MSAEGKKLKQSYSTQMRDQWQDQPMSDKVYIKLHLYFGDKRRRDIDNYNKLSIDSLTGTVLVDDSQIFRLDIIKDIDKSNPRIEITISKYR